MADLFRSVKAKRLKRNVFNLSHDVKLSTDFGRLTPILCKEVVPGDTFRIKSEMLIRTAPLYAPLMHRVNAYVHYFYVPSRLLMNDFDTFITGGENGEGTIVPRFGTNGTLVEKPYVTLKSLLNWYRSNKQALFDIVGNGSLFDYLGFPALKKDTISIVASSGTGGIRSNQKIDLLPFRAYQLIFNEYYRDQNFQDEVDILKDVNGDVIKYLSDNQETYPSANVGLYLDRLFRIKQRNWEKDYFTSALPWPQRGVDTMLGEGEERVNLSGDGFSSVLNPGTAGSVSVADIANKMTADLVGGSLVSINELRRALAVQKFRERLARYGSRYTEFLRGMFGVKPSDARLQRPEFIGGFKQPVSFGEVLQTSQTTEQSPQGAYAGTGFSLSGGKYLKARFVEHGYLLGILSIMPKPAYMQGWPREFDRFDKLDYFLPDFANIGEQSIMQKELVYSPTLDDTYENRTFGYIPRYSEYKYAASRVCGEMRKSLDFWHLARRFQQSQSLNQSFLEVNQFEMDRVFNYVGSGSTTEPVESSSDDHFWMQVYHDIRAVRPMPKFGTPLL